MDDFINLIERDQVQIKIEDILDKHIKSNNNCQSTIRYETLIQYIFLKN